MKSIVVGLENIIEQDNNKEGWTKLNNDDQIIDEIDKSSVFSRRFVTILEKSNLASAALQDNELIDGEEKATTSVSNEIEKTIHHEIFVTRNQKVNIAMKNTVKYWKQLKRNVKKGIDNNLKIILIKYA